MTNRRRLTRRASLGSVLVFLFLTVSAYNLAQSKSAKHGETPPPPAAQKGPVTPRSDSAQSQTDDFVIRAEVNMVNVPVNVRAHDGGFLVGLKKGQFHVYEDEVEQEIKLFSQERVPAHVVLLTDISESVRYEWGSIKNAARRFVERLTAEDKVAVIVFNHETRLLQNWTNVSSKISGALDSVFPKGRTFLWDALFVTCDDLLKAATGKKAIVLLSDGFDNCVSHIDIHPKRCVEYTEALDAAVKSGALVYVVSEVQALRHQMEYMAKQQGRQDDTPPEAYHHVDRLLRTLAYETGGKVLYPDSFGELGDVYAKVAEELKNQYSLGYVSTNAFKDGTYRKIRVAVEAPKASVSTRPGYYSPKRSS
ncbi:MAG: VWA domain-containing protein [Acidobacteria bacterium]|nr:VWA domain-containing protein [Acidobacteriota bacterium]MBI3656031.1 VWA domain-containing protein [Acidobacteriota bacterium]